MRRTRSYAGLWEGEGPRRLATWLRWDKLVAATGKLRLVSSR